MSSYALISDNEIAALLAQFTFTGGSVNVTGTVVVVPSGLPTYTSTVNKYGTILVPYNTETTVVSYTVPVGHTFYATGLRGSGDTNGEFYLKVNGVVVGYSRTTASIPACSEDYSYAPISAATAGQIVTITTITYPTDGSTQMMRATLLGGLV